MGLAARKLRPDGGKYATFYGIEGVANVIERNSGFADGAGDKFEKKAGMADGMKDEVAADNVRNALENHPDINTLVGIWAYDAHAIVTVVKERNIRDKMKIVVFDAAPKAIQHLKDGNIDAMVVQNPYGMGYQGTRLMKALYENDSQVVNELFPDYDFDKKEFKSADGDIRHTDVRVVVPNESPITKDDFDDSVKFFTIDEFDQWLKERNLIGS
jgi:ribose transport system substrate-binding protein